MAMLTATFPLPPTLNNAWAANRFGGLRRSPKYNAWTEVANRYWRSQYPEPVTMLTGRLRAQYIVKLKDLRPHDIGNYEKIIADFLEGKFYENDSQIDEVHIIRRVDRQIDKNFIHAYVSEVPDVRFMDLLSPDAGKQCTKPGRSPG